MTPNWLHWTTNIHYASLKVDVGVRVVEICTSGTTVRQRLDFRTQKWTYFDNDGYKSYHYKCFVKITVSLSEVKYSRNNKLIWNSFP